MGLTILFETVNERNEKSMEWAYYTKSFIKLERLGVIQMDYVSTIGTINSLNIDRFHITLFGELLLNIYNLRNVFDFLKLINLNN